MRSGRRSFWRQSLRRWDSPWAYVGNVPQGGRGNALMERLTSV